jgi:hypothetical protein
MIDLVNLLVWKATSAMVFRAFHLVSRYVTVYLQAHGSDDSERHRQQRSR